MPQFIQYPSTNYLDPSDVFLINRIGVGTLQISASYVSGGTYDIAMNFPGTIPGDYDTLMVFNAVRPYSLVSGIESSIFRLQAPPAEDIRFNVNKNNSLIGNIVFTAGNVDGYIEDFNSSVADFVAGDELIIVAPGDGIGAENISITFVASLT
jgi:hypothetical protein